MKIAVLGYGTIGSGVVEIVNTNAATIAKRAGEEIEVKYVLDLRDFPGDPVQDILVHDYSIIAQDEDVDIIVETMGSIRFCENCASEWKERLLIQQRTGSCTWGRIASDRT